MAKKKKRVYPDVAPVLPEHVDYLLANIRQQDIQEVWAAAHATPKDALAFSMSISPIAHSVMWKGRTLAIFGVGTPTLLSDTGYPWLLMTDELAANWGREFVRRGRPYIKEMLTKYTILMNFVDARNTDSVRWLKWLGFTLEDPAPYGPEGALFHRFTIKEKELTCASYQ